MKNSKCILCNNTIPLFRYKPMKEWNNDNNGYLCGTCYSKKLFEYYQKNKA